MDGGDSLLVPRYVSSHIANSRVYVKQSNVWRKAVFRAKVGVTSVVFRHSLQTRVTLFHPGQGLRHF